MVIRNGGNVQAINKLSDIKHDLVATSTVANIHHFKYTVFIFCLHKYIGDLNLVYA